MTPAEKRMAAAHERYMAATRELLREIDAGIAEKRRELARSELSPEARAHGESLLSGLERLSGLFRAAIPANDSPFPLVS